MPDEKESKIEALLRAAAGKRRSQVGAPFVLHPADRRRLHDEVAEKYGAVESRGSLSCLKRRMWTLSWGLATACVLAFGGWLIWDKNEQLAKTNPSTAEMRSGMASGETDKPLEAPPPVALGATEEMQLASAPQPGRERAMGAALPTATMDAVQPSELPSRSINSAVAQSPPAPMSKDSPEGVRPAAAPMLAARSTGTTLRQRLAPTEKSEEVFGGGSKATFYFASQTADREQLLGDFSLTPAPDGSLQVVDDDGSVYTGRWEAATTAGPAPVAPKEKPLPVQSLQVMRAATVRAEPAPGVGGVVLYSFTVTGTNQGMNGPVTFEGVVFTPQSNYSRLASTNVGKDALLDATDARVSGKVRLPSGKEIGIEASPVRK